MEKFKHVVNTWLLAQLMHFMFYASSLVWTGSNVSIAPLVLGFGFFFSIGGVLLCALCFPVLWQLQLPVLPKFLLWLVIMSLCIIVGVFLTCQLVLGYRLFFEMHFVLARGILAAVIAACIRFHQFRSAQVFNVEGTSVN